eukprot:jgi/Picre1/29790/NNA_005172.t1
MTTRAVARLRQVISLPGSNASLSLTSAALVLQWEAPLDFERDSSTTTRETYEFTIYPLYGRRRKEEEGTGSLTLSSLMRCWGKEGVVWAKEAIVSGAQKVSKKKNVDKAAEYEKRRGPLGSIVGAFDFSEVRSKSDAELLYDARYGKLEDGKMSRAQYQALRRKIGGTAKDYWKDWVDVKGEYTDKGYVSDDTNQVVGLPFLVAVVLAVLGTAGYVVSQTN